MMSATQKAASAHEPQVSAQINAAIYETVGQIVSLMSHSPMHRHFPVADLSDLILPPVLKGQYRLFHNEHGCAVAFVCWGFFSDAARDKFLGCKEVLTLEDWTSGSHVFVTDFIAPFGHAKKIVKELKTKVFPNDVVHALRYEGRGRPRDSVSTFYGVNVEHMRAAGGR